MSNKTRFILRCTRCEHEAAVYTTRAERCSGASGKLGADLNPPPSGKR